jgi:probable O-glycosylation ligase (exosortase A-associated)
VRDILLLIALAPMVVLALRNPFAAYVFWIWSGIATINSYMFGFFRSIPVSMVFAAIALVHVALNWGRLKAHFKPGLMGGLMVVLCLHVLVSNLLASNPNITAWDYATNLLKHVLACLLMPVMLTSRRRIYVFVLLIGFSIGAHGLIDALKFLVSAGGHNAQGHVKFGDNNQYALVLLMGLPLLMHSYRYAAHRLMRLGLAGLIPMVVLAVMATRSRGALACLMVVGLWYLWTGASKLRNIALVGAMSALVVAFAPADWVARMSTIQEAGADASFMQRVGAWQICAAIAQESPIFGGGVHASEVGALWNMHLNSSTFMDFMQGGLRRGLSEGRGRAAHSIYFEVLGDLGFVGLLWFLSIFVVAIWMNSRTAAHWRKFSPSGQAWQADLATALTLSFVAFATGGALLSMAYTELPYYFGMLSALLYGLTQVDRKAVARRRTNASGASSASGSVVT